MCVLSLQAIAKACAKGGNAPGAKTYIKVTTTDEIASIPARDDYPTTGDPHTISGDIVMRALDGDTPAGVFVNWDFSKMDFVYNSPQQGDEDSPTFQNTITFFIPKKTAAKDYALNEAAFADLVCVIELKDGKREIIGDKGSPARLSVTPQATPKNGYVCTITQESGELPLNYTGAIVE